MLNSHHEAPVKAKSDSIGCSLTMKANKAKCERIREDRVLLCNLRWLISSRQYPGDEQQHGPVGIPHHCQIQSN